VIEKLVLFGASGDLAGRFLLPALAALQAANRLPAEFRVVGAARQDWDDHGFRRHAEERLDEHAADVPLEARRVLTRGLRYRQVDLEDSRSITSVLEAAGSPDDALAAYLALPPGLFPAATTGLSRAGLPTGSRIVLEKPFGEDLEEAVALNALLAELFEQAGEQAVFRVDHVLGMAPVQNLLALRLANRVLEPLWNSDHIEQIEVLWEETLGLEGRAGYYDRTGAVKDVMQNHMLQVLSLLAMEPPASLDERDLRDAKVAVLRAMRPPRGEDIVSLTRRARYDAGRLCGETVPAYAAEDGVEPERGTETFAELVLGIDSPRWEGTRFVLRAGKALNRRRKGAVVRFRPAAKSPFGDAEDVPADELHLGVDGPVEIALRLAGRRDDTPQLAPVSITGEPPSSGLPAYGHVLLGVLSGDNALSVRGDEAEQAWRVVTPVLEAWAEGRVPLEEYPAGSAGPPALTGRATASD
jgi:glucose-6-phosphate 1-dehydrogenase